MSVFRRSAVRTIVLAVLSLPVFGQHQEATPPERDAQSIEILRRVVQAAGGLQALAAVHDLTESGKITFHWGEGHTGPVTIRTMGTNHFRMEANLPKGKQTWLVNDGNGTIQKPDQNAIPFSNENTVIGNNLNFPITLVAAALNDAKAGISLVRIESRNDRSIYRLRVKGRLGLSSKTIPILPVTKDLLIDALNFSILSVEDRPIQTYKIGGKRSDKPSCVIEFSDFRTVTGVLVPFSISTKFMGQPLLSIHLTSVTFNNNLSPTDFDN